MMSQRRKSLKSFVQTLEEAGYAGQGHGSGAESFYGTYFGLGGDKQLAKKPDPTVQKIKKMTDAEAGANFQAKQQRARGYPASRDSLGISDEGGVGASFPGEELNQVGKSPQKLDSMYITDPRKDYWSDKVVEDDPSVLADEEAEEEALAEQLGTAIGGGAGRSVASDSNYRNLPGWPRMNSVEEPFDFIPDVEGDVDGDGEEDEYLGDDEYVNDVLRLNGLDFAPGDFKRLFGVSTLEEQGSYVSPGYGPEPNKGIERYKQGKLVRDHEPDATKKLIKHVDYTQGHTDMASAERSPGGQAYGQVGAPKDFVPEDWEQRHWKTKEGEEPPMDMSQLEEMVQIAVREALDERRVISAKKLMKKLRKNKSPGCDHVRQKGSHATYKCDKCQTVVPVHGSKDIKPGTLKSIERDLEPCLGDDWLDEAVAKIVATELEEAFTGLDDETGKGEPKGGSQAFRKNRGAVLDYDEKQKPKGTEDLENYHLGDDD